MRIFACLTFLAVLTSAEKARFDNYRVYSVLPQNEKQLILLKNLESATDYNFWLPPSFLNKTADIMVAPHKRDEFHSLLEEFRMESNIKIPDVQSLIDVQEYSARFRAPFMEWTNYHRLNEIYDWLDELEEKYPEIVKVVVGGKTYEGRDIKGIEIKFGDGLTGVLMESGIHAREWIGPAATSWMMNQILLSKPDSIFRKYNYLYFPSINPDGYEYTWNANRMWRKTRTPYKNGAISCKGADPNRNWDLHWGEVGTSKNPCDETYRGPKEFSEVETKTLSDYVKGSVQRLNLKIFLTFHSYSQLILYPWGFTEEPAHNADFLHKVSKAAAESLEAVHGTDFVFGPIYTTIYPTSGTSVEWYYGALNATLSFTYELRDKGKHGFILPPDQIIPTGEETLASVKTVLEECAKVHK